MILPEKHDFYCYKGQTWTQTLRFRQNEQPIDLSGYAAKSQIKREQNSPIAIAEFTIDVIPAEGNVLLTLSAEKTAKLRPGRYVYDFKLTDDKDEVQYYLRGKFIVEGRVTE